MNVIGEIGNFIINYQEPIQAGVILVILIAALIVIIKLWRGAKKKREILSQINDTVSEINTAVNHLNEKKADVIYIDSRIAQGAEKPVQIVEDGQVEFVETEKAAGGNEAVMETEAVSDTPTEETVEKIEPSLKYFSRDCAVSKNGKQFTFEELDAQIKE